MTAIKYQNFIRTEASYHIYTSECPVINVKVNFCAYCRDNACCGFKNGRRSSSWIYWTRVWTTHNEYLVVFIVVQNLVGIDVVVVIVIMQFQYFAR